MSHVVAQQLVDPERLLVVAYRDPVGSEHEVAAIGCRYVPAVDATGRRAVALEILFDPETPAPTAPYYRPAQELRELVLDPRRIVRIRPYAT